MNIPLHELKRTMEAIPVLQAARDAAYEAKWAMRNRSNVGKTCEESVAAEDASDSAFDALRDAEADLAEAAVNALPSLLAAVESALKLRAAQHIIDADPDEVNWDAFAKAIEQHAELAAATDEALALFQGKEPTP